MLSNRREAEILAHYVKLWGEPTACTEFGFVDGKTPPKIRVYKFLLEEASGEWVFATLGASARPLSGPPGASDLRMELFLMCEGDREEVAGRLAMVASYPFQTRSYLAEGHTIHGSPHGGMVDGSPLTDIVITRADFGELPDYAEHKGGKHTHLFWVVPIYPAERELVATEGWASLKRIFEGKGTNVLDLFRISVV